jgi:putative ABC transport system permease protein
VVSALGRKLVRDLGESRSALAAVGLVIVVGVSSFVGFASAHGDLVRAQRDYYRASRMADFWIDLEQAPRAEAEALIELAGVTEAQPRLMGRALASVGEAEAITTTVVSVDPRQPRGVNRLVLQRGRGLDADDEAIVGAAFASARGLAPGDTIALTIEGERRELRIVGIAISAEFAYLMGPGGLFPDPANHGLVFVTDRLAEEAMNMVGACNQVVGMVVMREGGPAPMEPVLAQIRERMAPYGVLAVTPRSRQPSHQILTDELAQLRITGVILPGIFLLVAALVLNIVLTRSVQQQRTVIGTLKALGYSDRRLAAHYLSAGALVGLAGGVLGVITGALLARGLMALYRVYFEFPELTSTPAPLVWAAGVAVSVLAAGLGAARGVRAVVRLQPAQAMRPGGAVELRAPGRWSSGGLALRLPLAWRMALRSMGRRKGRTATGMLAAALGAALLFTTFYFIDAMNYLVEFQFRLASRSHYDIALVGAADERVVDEIGAMPGAVLAEGLFELPCELRSGHIERLTSVTGVAAGARLTSPRGADGALLTIPARGLLLSRRMAEILGAGAGETVTLTPVRGEQRPRQVLVAGIADGFLGMATYADRAWLQDLVDEPGAVTDVQVVVAPDATQRAGFRRELAGLGGVEAITDYQEVERQLDTVLLDSLRYSVSALVLMAGTLFFGSVLGATLTSVSQRQREVATNRAMGMRPREIGAMFLAESLLTTGAGAIVGLPLGLGLSIWLIEMHSRDAYRLPVVTSPQAWLLTLILAALFTVVAHVVAQRTIDRFNWREGLKTAE